MADSASRDFILRFRREAAFNIFIIILIFRVLFFVLFCFFGAVFSLYKLCRSRVENRRMRRRIDRLCLLNSKLSRDVDLDD